MVMEPWNEAGIRRKGGQGRRLLLWLRPGDTELTEAVDRVSEEKGVPRSAVARWLALLGLEAAKKGGMVLLLLLAGCVASGGASQHEIDWFVGFMLRSRAQGYHSTVDTEKATDILDRMNDSEFQYVLALIGSEEEVLREIP